MVVWKRERLPTPVFWPGEFYGLYSPWGRKESDTTERLSLSNVFKSTPPPKVIHQNVHSSDIYSSQQVENIQMPMKN